MLLTFVLRSKYWIPLKSRVFHRAMSTQLTMWENLVFSWKMRIYAEGELRRSNLTLIREIVLWSSRTTLEQVAPRKILLLREI
jgi:hypothetical protein